MYYRSRILGESLLISSLPGKAPRTLSDSTCILEAEPGEADIKRRQPVILLISLQVCSLFLTSNNDAIIYLCVNFTTLTTSFKKCNFVMTDKDTCSEIENVYQVDVQKCSLYER